MKSVTLAMLWSLATFNAAAAQADSARTHQALVKLYEEFRAFTIPELNEGVPDYTPAAMTRKREGLRALQQRLADLDTAGWSLAERVDYLVVKAEMSGMEFDHRVLRPWSRDPAFYVVISFQFGPKMYGATGLPRVPIAPDRVEPVRQRLHAIPAILEQAKQNLTEPAADLLMLGIRSKNREEGLIVAFRDSLRRHHPALVPLADSALTAVRAFRGWLEEIRPTVRARAGIGAANYTWFMRNVMLLPYSWEELNTITQRDLDRSLALMTMEEHRNRALPSFDLIDSAEEYRERHVQAQHALLDFLRRESVMTVPDFIEVRPPAGFQTTRPLDYFQNVNYRDPMALLPHDFLVHTPDAQRRSADTRPIRGARRLYFVDGQRQDGLATALEQILMQLGSLDGRPRAKELAHNLFALRAVRALSDLKLHGAGMSIMEAFQYNIDNTPKGWLPENSSTMWHDLELYLRQPGYGVGYLIGLAQIEQLMATRAKQLGAEFSMRRFMDDFVNAGLIPISLIAWEMTGATADVVASRPPRERPAMVPCPWPVATVKAAEPEVSGNQRPRIPDCTPPDWQAPAELEPYRPRPLPADRPKPVVEDYLKYAVTLPPPEIVARFNLDTTFYKKYADANGYPILASAKVPDAALAIVRDQVNYMLGHRPDVRDTMIARGARIGIMAETEYTTDVPEQRNWTVPKYLDPRLTPGERESYYQPGGLGYRSGAGYWNGRARGMGGTFTTCAEENVLGYYNTRYWGTNICVHEFSHGIMGAGIANADPKWFQEIVDAYKAAKACGLRTANGYAGNTFNEYWAVGVEWYVGNGGRDRAQLKREDPVLYELISRLIPEDKYLPVRANVANRTRDELTRYVQERNPEWWQREQARVAAAAASGRGGRAGGAGNQPPARPIPTPCNTDTR